MSLIIRNSARKMSRSNARRVLQRIELELFTVIESAPVETTTLKRLQDRTTVIAHLDKIMQDYFGEARR